MWRRFEFSYARGLMSYCFKNQILSFDARAPRYTSYPTAPQFKALEKVEIYANALGDVKAGEEISLYLHVPYCSKMCWYCGCNTKVTKRYDPVSAYVDLLLEEVETLARHLSPDHIISNIHFGGGSPGMLKARDFDRIMTRLRDTLNVADTAEIAIEIDPRGITEDRVASYAKNGVNRVSLGVQDFDEKVLKAINRQQPFSLSYDAVQMLRSYGITQINVDVMYGLPYQTMESQARTFEQLMFLDPSRIAYFGYAHVPWMKKHMRLINEETLPQKDLRFDLFHAGAEYFTARGYVGIGIDHFAKPDDSLVRAMHMGTMRRNFQGYVDDACESMIGLGASSIGKIDGHFFQNYPDMPSYKKAITGGILAAGKSCGISDEDRLRSDVIEQLMCYLRVDLVAICRAHGVSLDHFTAEIEALRAYEKIGFIEITPAGVIDINPDALLMTRMICSVFDAYLKPASESDTPKHAQAV